MISDISHFSSFYLSKLKVKRLFYQESRFALMLYKRVFVDSYFPNRIEHEISYFYSKVIQIRDDKESHVKQ